MKTALENSSSDDPDKCRLYNGYLVRFCLKKKKRIFFSAIYSLFQFFFFNPVFPFLILPYGISYFKKKKKVWNKLIVTKKQECNKPETQSPKSLPYHRPFQTLEFFPTSAPISRLDTCGTIVLPPGKKPTNCQIKIIGS